MFIILSFGIVKTEDILSICIPKLRISFPHYRTCITEKDYELLLSELDSYFLHLSNIILNMRKICLKSDYKMDKDKRVSIYIFKHLYGTNITYPVESQQDYEKIKIWMESHEEEYLLLLLGKVHIEHISHISILPELPERICIFFSSEERYYIDSKKQIDYVLSFFERKQVLK